MHKYLLLFSLGLGIVPVSAQSVDRTATVSQLIELPEDLAKAYPGASCDDEIQPYAVYEFCFNTAIHVTSGQMGDSAN